MQAVTRVILAQRPRGSLTPADLRLESAPLPSLAAGEVHLQTLMVSVETCHRLQLAGRHPHFTTRPGDTIAGNALCRVVRSRVRSIHPGELVIGSVGWCDRAIVSPDSIMPLMTNGHAPGEYRAAAFEKVRNGSRDLQIELVTQHNDAPSAFRDSFAPMEEGLHHVAVVPDDYAEHDGDPIGELFRALGQTNHRAAHIHFKLRVAGKERLVTQLFMPTSKTLDHDYVVGAVSDDLTLSFRDGPALPGHGKHYEAQFDFRV